MSEAELHVIKARLRGGILNTVRRGEYRCPLPTGFIYDDFGNVVLDPDAQVRELIAHFFETFSRVGSATQTVKVFAREGLLFPSRLRNGKQVVFQPLTASTAMRTLHNPRYAGVYAYGQRLYRRTVGLLHHGKCNQGARRLPPAEHKNRMELKSSLRKNCPSLDAVWPPLSSWRFQRRSKAGSSVLL